MPDNTNDRGPQDRSRVSMEEDYEVRYWTNKFSVTQDRLQQAVDAVGNSADAIEQYLARR